MRLHHSLGWMFLAFFTALGLPLSAAAQETTGTIIGTVTDDSGAVLPGVTVVLLKHLAPGRRFERVTSDAGAIHRAAPADRDIRDHLHLARLPAACRPWPSALSVNDRIVSRRQDDASAASAKWWKSPARRPCSRPPRCRR